jgi:TRAP transporter TAXI family solute receptor
MKSTKILFAAVMFLAFPTFGFSQMTILSGPKKATQYSLVQDLTTIVAPSLDFKIVNRETDGASYNLEQLMNPDSPYKVALIQSDYLFYMQAQDMKMNMENTKNVKVVLPLGHEQIHLVTKASKGITGLRELEKKVVAIGSADQGTYRTASLMKERSQVGWIAKNTNFEDAFGALNTDKIDAFFIVSSAPIEKLNVDPQSMVDQLALVPLENFNDWAKYYKADTIYKGEYKWLEQDVPTYSVPAVLIVNEKKLSADERADVMALKAAIQAKFEELKASGHPQWKQVNLMEWNEADWPMIK